MGGNLPLGYDAPTDPVTRALAVNQAEAERVRLIFDRYLALCSVHDLQRWLNEQGIRSKAWTSSRGRSVGGCPFGRGALFHLLKNRTYIGEIPHRKASYPGSHPGIVDSATFDEVQARLAKQTRRAREPKRVAAAPLKGLIFDATGEPMSPVHTHRRRGKVYRYYASTSLLRGRRADASDGVVRRVPGPALETLVRDALARLADKPNIELPGPLITVDVGSGVLEMRVPRAALTRNASSADRELAVLTTRLAPGEEVHVDPADEAIVKMVLPCQLRRAGGVVSITNGSGTRRRADPDDTLIAALKAAHALLAEGSDGPVGLVESARLRTAPDDPYKRTLIRLAFLAPDIQSSVLEGRQPIGLNRQRLVLGAIPPAWADQRRLFAFP
ncbi:MAG TPA: recombinase family protein [Caulobacteraceae bacterium]|nr:recombinase family protein [Caulobacteraceae bacterium]